MLALNVTVTGDKVVINGLNQLTAEMPNVVQRGLKRVVRGVHRNAMDFLNGPATASAPSSGKKMNKVTLSSGGYPVPVRTGNIKRLLDFVDPGQSKSSAGASFIAGPMEAIVYDSAEYASVIHQGTGSSAKFGKRPFIDDALAAFNQSDGIANVIEQELQAEIKKRGLV